MNLFRVAILIVVAGTAAAGVSASVRWRSGERRARAREALLASVPRTERPGGYVASDRCEACHPSQHASWHRTFHRTMTQVATPSSVAAPFEGDVTLDGQTFRLRRDDDWLSIDGQRVVMSTGSHHQQLYWIRNPATRTNELAPLVYLIDDERWVRMGDNFVVPHAYGPERFPMTWNFTCIKCHATAGQQRRRGQGAADTQVAELGIACEACHGPGESHVAANRSPLRRARLHLGGGRDSTIVNPARLRSRASSEICGMCHAIRQPASRRDLADYQENGHRFRPGDIADRGSSLVRPALGHVDGPVEDFFFRDGVVRVSGRELNGIVESRCHQEGELSCLSCHSMHDSDPDDQLARGKQGDEACFACHGELRTGVEAHTHHPAASDGSRCMNCHMPYTSYGLLKAVRSHTINVPSVTSDLEAGRPNACNLCHLDRSLAWTADALARWTGRGADVPEDRRTVAEGVRLLLRGDAGQRVLAAWSAGWKPAQEASGRDWVAPYLGILLEDPYAAVRYVAYRSLRTLPAHRDLRYDYVGSEAERAAVAATVREPLDPANAALLRARDDHPMELRE